MNSELTNGRAVARAGSEEGAGGGGRAANSGTIGEWHYGCLARQRSSAIMWRIRSQRAIDCQEKESANWNHPLKQMEEENASMHEETRRLRDEQQFSDCSCGNLGFFSLLFRSCDTPIRREGGKVAPPPPHPPADRVFVAEYRMQRRNRTRRPTTGAAARRVPTHATFCMCRVCNCRFCGFVLTVHTLN